MAGGAVASVADALSAAVDGLRAAGVDSPRLDAELLLAAATGMSRSALVAESERGLSAGEARAFGSMVRRRVAREPVAYILGRKGFRRIELRVDRRALIPRPETELLVELAVRERPRSVLDVGTGSGAIALAVADELPDVEVVAVDTSVAALDLARSNAAALGLDDRVSWELGEWPGEEPEGGFDLVLANLPYVPDADSSSLAPEILRYEPGSALFAGADGLDAIRGLLGGWMANEPATDPACLPHAGENGGHRPSTVAGKAEGAPSAREPSGRQRPGAIALEIGVGQGPDVSALLAAAGFVGIEAIADLAGIPRVVVGRSPASRERR